MTDRVCIIPVRAGSKGVPDKNIRDFRGEPLLAHSIRHALETDRFAEIAVTSDSDAYLDIAQKAGATQCIKRPAELATDTAGSMDVLLHALAACETTCGKPFATITLLQATSPLRLAEHVRDAIATLEDQQLESVVSVAKAKNSPYFNLLEHDAETDTYALSKPLDHTIQRRQDAPAVFQLNGSIYVWSRTALIEQKKTLCARTGVYLMPELYSVDIDTEDDWAFAELAADLLAQRMKQSPAEAQG